MSTRERRDDRRQSGNYGRRDIQDDYGQRGDQSYGRPAFDNDSEQGEEARRLGSARDEDFAEEGYVQGGRNYSDEERYGSGGYGSDRYQGYERQGEVRRSSTSSGQVQRRRYGDRRDQSYGALRGDQGYGPDPRGSAPASSGGFRGKGPKGYQRSDERIAEEVNQVLADDDDLDASNIEVSVSAGEVTLSGTVTERHDKRWAEDLVEGISGVSDVQNHLRVKREAAKTDSSSQREAEKTSGT